MDDIKNAFILSSDILHRCNYFTSIEGLVVTHIIRDRLTYYLPRVLYVPLNLLIVAFECVLNLVSDYSTLSFTFMGLKKHQDFSKSIWVGDLNSILIIKDFPLILKLCS